MVFSFAIQHTIIIVLPEILSKGISVVWLEREIGE
jgi:hypothetical protein